MVLLIFNNVYKIISALGIFLSFFPIKTIYFFFIYLSSNLFSEKLFPRISLRALWYLKVKGFIDSLSLFLAGQHITLFCFSHVLDQLLFLFYPEPESSLC